MNIYDSVNDTINYQSAVNDPNLQLKLFNYLAGTGAFTNKDINYINKMMADKMAEYGVTYNPEAMKPTINKFVNQVKQADYRNWKNKQIEKENNRTLAMQMANPLGTALGRGLDKLQGWLDKNLWRKSYKPFQEKTAADVKKAYGGSEKPSSPYWKSSVNGESEYAPVSGKMRYPLRDDRDVETGSYDNGMPVYKKASGKIWNGPNSSETTGGMNSPQFNRPEGPKTLKGQNYYDPAKNRVYQRDSNLTIPKGGMTKLNNFPNTFTVNANKGKRKADYNLNK